jgi:hypothetical protein
MHIKLGTCVPNLRGRWWVEHTRMHPALKRGTNNFYYTSKTCGIFSDLNFPWNKNPNGRHMEVQVYSKFRKNKISKKVKSPNSMRNGRFDTSKCRGKLEKMGVLCTHSPKSLGPFSKLPIKIWKKKKDFKKKDQADPVQASTCGRLATAGRCPALGWCLDWVGLPLFKLLNRSS